jgi:hypothetical protein
MKCALCAVTTVSASGILRTLPRSSDEPCEQRGPFAGLQSLSFDVSENPTIALVMRFDNIEHAQAARDQLWQPAGASRDASAGEAAEVQK